MAINSECPGLKVEVLVEGQALQEYDNDDDEESSPKVTTKYIEAHSDKDFALRTTFSAPFPSQYGVAAHVRVDGMAETGIAYELGDLNGQQGYIKEGICMKKDGAWSQYKYHFTTLNIAEDVDNPVDVPQLRKDLHTKGRIELSFWYITNTRADNLIIRKEYELPQLGAIPEKALKGEALSHQATFSAPHPIGPPKPCLKCDYVDRKPFVTFCFKYRSMAALRSLRIVTGNTQDPIPLEDRPEEELNPEEMRELLRRMRRREANGDTIKQETGARSEIKRERIPDDDDDVTFLETRSRKRPHVDPEVIVLD